MANSHLNAPISRAFQQFTNRLVADTTEGAQLRDCLEDPYSFNLSQGQHFYCLLHEAVTETNSLTKADHKLFSDYLAWLGRVSKEFPEAAALGQTYARKKKEISRRRLNLAKTLHLNPDAKSTRDHVEQIFKKVKVIVLNKEQLQRPAYPPKDVWMVESEAIRRRWEVHLQECIPADSRREEKPVMMVDMEKLSYDLGPEESAMFVNEVGELQFLVLRDFCGVQDVREWCNIIIRQHVDVKRNARKEDPGSIVLTGFSAGVRSARSFGWVRNLVRKRGATPTLEDDGASANAIFWNMARGILLNHPVAAQIIYDTENFIMNEDLYHMDQGLWQGERGGQYWVDVGDGEPILFNNAELAPPSGAFAVNYTRCVHTERQPHKFVMSWTTSRDGSVDRGGHFYNCRLHTRVQAARNTLVVHIPEEEHGTSLQDVDPEDPEPEEVNQAGMSIFTSNLLPGVFRKFVEGLITCSEAEEIAFADVQ
ncbi:hypothetical protein AAF712_007574 [Marasmius tenuissimus]|uniref:Uncharacterized protein n=1 Tax=Marasmius tenuissimus TaxID=585030 RepID=A0ABR2ZWC7_9AGAR